MKVTLVLCVLAISLTVVLGSGGHGHVSYNDSPHCRPPAGHGHGGHGDGHGGGNGGHGDAHGDAHGNAHDAGGHDTHGSDKPGSDGHGNSESAASPLQLCSILFSFVLMSTISKF